MVWSLLTVCKDSSSITKVFKHVDSSIPSCELGVYRITTAHFTQEHVELSLIWQHAIGCLQNVQHLIPLRNTSSLLRQDNNLSADHGFYQGLFQSITIVPKGWFSSQVHLAEPDLEPINDHVSHLKSILIKHQYRLHNPVDAQDYFVIFLVAKTKYEFCTTVGLDT